MKKLFYSLCCVLTVCACNEKEASEFVFWPDENDLKPHTEKTVSVLRNGLPGGSVEIRIYEDLPSVPYMSIADFHSMMLSGAAVREEWGEDGLSVIAPGGTAVVNPAEETFRCAQYESFVNLMGLVQPGMDNAYMDGMPFIRYSHTVSAGLPPAPVEFDFREYGIDLRADKGGVYFPFVTLADIYSDLYYHYAFCTGDKVIIADRDSDEIAIDAQEPSLTLQNLLTKTRAADMAEFAYKELCFVVDNFYGMPGRSTYELELRAFGLDGTLEASAEGRMVKALLHSANPIDYAAGLEGLNIFLGDGGHTKIWKTPEILLNPDLRYATDYPSLVELYRNTYKAALTNVENTSSAIYAMRMVAYMDLEHYHKKGDTAIVHFDDFHNLDYAAWRAYYAGTGPLPTMANVGKQDQMTLFLDALKKADEDPDVKNFVIDLTMNRGGSMDLVVAMTSLMYGQSFSRIENVLTGERLQWFYDVDRNLDGKFNAADADVHYNLNFGVLVGRVSFSCGNMFPAICKDAGILLMGERCGGGGCGVGVYRTADGIQYQISSAHGRMSDAGWQNIDSGVVPQVLIQPGPDMTLNLDDGSTFTIPNLSGFYDLSHLSELMNEYYKYK